MLKCNSCLNIKEKSDFKKDKRRQFLSRDGRHTMCKSCENNLARTRYKIYDDDDFFVNNNSRICTNCKELKLLKFFVKSHAGVHGRGQHCKACANEKARNNRKSKGLKHRSSCDPKISCKERTLYYKYGINLEDYKKLFSDQHGKCAICFRQLEIDSKETCVDHDHKTGKVREILCNKCNSGIGFLQENTMILQSAIDYLIKHGKKED